MCVRWFRLLPVLALLCAAPGTVSGAAAAPVSEIVVDAGSGRVLRSRNADLERAPASLAKMMTLLLVFDALRDGRLKPGGTLTMTAEGERQPPSRLGLRRGRTIDVRAAIRAVAVISANDVAVAFAGRLAGSERAFVTRMNARAAALGMRHTRFVNATGLTSGAGGGRTTARDMYLLSRHIVRTYPAYYRYFSTRSIRWEGTTRPSHNKLLGRVGGLDGIKTGYTRAAGFNLAASARRDGKRVIVVVMGAPGAAQRDLLVSNLLEVGFSSPKTVPARRPAPKRAEPKRAAPRAKRPRP